MDENTSLAAMLLGALGILSGAISYLFRLLVTSGNRRMTDLQAHLDRVVAAKDAQIAERDAEIARLNKTVSELREHPPRGRGGT